MDLSQSHQKVKRSGGRRMKKDEILKIIKEDLEKETPDVLHKINLSQIDINPAQQAYDQKKQRFVFKPQFILAPLLLILILTVSFLPSFLKNRNQVIPFNKAISAKEQLVILQTQTALEITKKDKQLKVIPTMSLNNTQDHDHINIFHEYIDLIQEKNQQNTAMTKELNTLGKGTYAKKYFPYQIELKSVNAFKETITYHIYYQSNFEVEDDETEEEMYGYIVYENIAYYFKAENEIEQDESEFKITLYLTEDQKNYIKIEEEKEQDESEYIYTKYINHQKIEVVHFQKEVKNQRTQITLMIEKMGHTFEFDIIVIQRGKYFIEYQTDQSEGTFELEILEEGYRYKIDGQTIDKK
mgnify:FL=1